MQYHTHNVDVYTTKNKQLGVLVHRRSQVVLAVVRGGTCVNTTNGLAAISGQRIYDALMEMAWYQIDYSNVLAMTRKLGKVREPLRAAVSA